MSPAAKLCGSKYLLISTKNYYMYVLNKRPLAVAALDLLHIRAMFHMAVRVRTFNAETLHDYRCKKA
jgi:hypothetical protein